MCGIVGQMYFSDNARQVDPVLLARMRDTMAHRGPDGSGLWLSEDHKVGLAQRRLAIIDLSDAAAQPVRDGELVVTFNGEIYNHVALRQELERLGVGAWQTDHSDTEVILKAYRAWGIDCVHRFRGMFAFALWDGGQRLLRLVRDRIGVKPFYYASQRPESVRGLRQLPRIFIFKPPPPNHWPPTSSTLRTSSLNLLVDSFLSLSS